MADETNGGSEVGGLPEIELIIKASTIDGRRKGACLFCQEYFMDLYLLAELKTVSLKITTVDMQRPPPDFRSNFEATPPPILIDRGLAVLENDKIERHIMKQIPGGHNLFVSDKEVQILTENVFRKFKVMLLKKDDASKTSLLQNLKRINEHRPRHHQPLQTAAGHQNDKERRIGNAILYKHSPRGHLNTAIETPLKWVKRPFTIIPKPRMT